MSNKSIFPYLCALAFSIALLFGAPAVYVRAQEGGPTDALPADAPSQIAEIAPAQSSAALLGDIKAISAGGTHTCALTTAGGVKCWGLNAYGQLGDGMTNERSMPMDVSGLTSGVQAISAGGAHTCALTIVGDVKCWGWNRSGQLGDRTNTDRSAPVAVSGLTSGVQAISTGEEHTCALTTAGGVKCWGFNSHGELGDGTNTNSWTPVAVRELTSGVQAISAGAVHTCALTTAGGAKCWGFNSHGELGNGTNTDSWTPVAVRELTSGVRAISAGGSHTCTLMIAGDVKCWGYNGYGALGDGENADRWTPVAVNGLTSGVQAISAGAGHSCALTAASGVKCWGYNGFGQVGDGSSIPADVSGLAGSAQATSAGGGHTCALTTAGGVKCWGWNVYGQLGDGTNTDRRTPVDVLAGEPPAPSCSDDQWIARYYPDVDMLQSTAIARCESAVDYYWGPSAKVATTDISATTFGAKWSRTINITAAGWYRFRAFWDDRLRFAIDGVTRIDGWESQAFRDASTVQYLAAGAHTLAVDYANLAGDAMVNLDWYLCPNGQGDCSLNITPQYQTKYLSTAMPTQCTAVNGQTIAAWGCAITSAAMALQAHGINVSPDELNTWLSSKGGYPYAASCNANLDWQAIVEFAKQRTNGAAKLKWVWAGDPASVIRTQHQPVVLSVAGGGHYILATDVAQVGAQVTLGVNDPHHAWACKAVQVSGTTGAQSALQCTTGALRHASTVIEESSYRGISNFKGYLASTNAGSSTLQINIGGSQAQVVNGANQVSGYDPVTGNFTTGIPNSFYFDSNVVPPNSEASATLRQTFFLPENADGAFWLRLFQQVDSAGFETEPIQISIIRHEADGTVHTVELSSLDDTIHDEYQIVAGPEAGLQVGPGIDETRVYLPSIRR